MAGPHRRLGAAKSRSPTRTATSRLTAATTHAVELLSRHTGGRVAAFTHGLFMRVAIRVVLTGETAPDAASMRRFHRFRTSYQIPDSSIVEVLVHPDRGPTALSATTSHLPRALRTGDS